MLIERQLFRTHGKISKYITIWKHMLHSQETTVRVRFAPSPTGELHLGGLRTALYNFLFARNKKGKFLLRIEDTDQTRLVPGAAERLMEDLLWSGIEIDEGPGFGGSYGPYIQSERQELYSVAVQQLLDNGSAYRCFCSERRLDLLRREALRLRQVPKYDNKCRSLTTEEIEALLAQGTPHCIRFKLSEQEEPTLQDLIYGRVTHNVAETEGDPVILKTTGWPTYHLANVVDDHLMGVTHVLRGVEWQISTPKHLSLYRAFGWQPPQYGHLPLLINTDGSKLSKRQGDIGVKQFRERGYFPESLINYVVSAGGGFARDNKKSTQQIYTLTELAEQFSLERVNAHPSRLNPELLDEFNRQELIRRLKQPEMQQKLIEQVQNLVVHTFHKENCNLDLDTTHIAQVLQWAANRLTFLSDLTSDRLSFLWVKPELAQTQLTCLTMDQLDALVLILSDSRIFESKTSLSKALKSFASQNSLQVASFMKSLRSALSGLEQGPGVAEMMHILGQSSVLQRLQAVKQTHYEKALKNEKLST